MRVPDEAPVGGAADWRLGFGAVDCARGASCGITPGPGGAGVAAGGWPPLAGPFCAIANDVPPASSALAIMRGFRMVMRISPTSLRPRSPKRLDETTPPTRRSEFKNRGSRVECSAGGLKMDTGHSVARTILRRHLSREGAPRGSNLKLHEGIRNYPIKLASLRRICCLVKMQARDLALSPSFSLRESLCLSIGVPFCRSTRRHRAQG
jgi:hypothetical protein